MSKPAWDESRKFYASRLPHDWWARVLARSDWGSQFIAVTSPGAFPYAAVQLGGVNPKRVALRVGTVGALAYFLGEGPFTVASASTFSNGVAFQVVTHIQQFEKTLLTCGRSVQKSWFSAPTATAQTGTYYFGELVCDIDPFDFDALYED